MAPGSIKTQIEEVTIEQGETHQGLRVGKSPDDILGKLSHEVFKYDCLDRRLKRHHVTGIAFSGAVGIGLFQTSGQIIAIGGPVGAFLAYLFAGLTIFAVMRSLAEIVSVRPVSGAIMDYPDVFVDEALGFAVGVMYWWGPALACLSQSLLIGEKRLANCISMVTLTIAAAMFTQYWGPGFGVAPATFILLLVIVLMNACGVRIYGNLEWTFKWVKILLIFLICISMIAIKAGAGPKSIHSNFEISPGYNSTGFFEDGSTVAIPGTGGRIMAVWTCITVAMFQFMGGEIVLVTAAEAESPRRDLPTAARYMYLLPVSLYLVGIFLVGLCINYLDPRLPHPHVDYYPTGSRLDGITTGTRSPFVIVIQTAGVPGLPGFLNAAFLFSALTAANSALYVSSRTLFFLARKSSFKFIKETAGRTNNGHTPLAAIAISFLPGALAFLVVGAAKTSVQEPIFVLSRLYTGPILCIYASECLAFLRFRQGMKLFPNTIDRNKSYYKEIHYRAHWQPLWAIIGLVICTFLMLSFGWAAIYDLCARTKGVTKEGSVVDLATAYLGPALFFGVYFAYKYTYKTKIRSYSSFENLWYPIDVPDEPDTRRNSKAASGKRRPILGFLSWLR
ncbi:MAG: Cationic amino acid transporter 2 [Alectoria fallacina]|uniref:Cationic amino acid transporter 2 n=1 Tax=Alectoria fallacina TaxID=1903189 RepID=A0A8H3J4B0_9LECA|nr:MAG: Cationic amino acid transporter 2 [Alectoria fallacina]